MSSAEAKGTAANLAAFYMVDLAAITAGASGFPPMLSGARAFGGAVCPYGP